MSHPRDRYIRLIDATLRTAMIARPTSASSDSVSIALPFACQVIGQSNILPTFDAEVILRGRLSDGGGHSRPLYRGLVIHAITQLNGNDGSLVHAFAGTRRSTFDAFLGSDAVLRAAEGSRWVELVFDALAIACAPQSPIADATRAGDVIRRIGHAQQTDGSFLDRTASDNPEPMWYHELALLHAVASYAFRKKHRSTLDIVRRAAQYQAEQIQPDHATSHPLAMHAFLQEPHGIQLADMMLHAAGVQEPSTMDAVSLLLLADALACLQADCVP